MWQVTCFDNRAAKGGSSFNNLLGLIDNDGILADDSII